MQFGGLYLHNIKLHCAAQQAAYMRRVTTVPFYDTFDQETIQHILNHTELSTVVCSDELLDHVINAKPACPHLKFVVRVESSPSQALQNRCKERAIELFTFQAVAQLRQATHRYLLSPAEYVISPFCYPSCHTSLPTPEMPPERN